MSWYDTAHGTTTLAEYNEELLANTTEQIEISTVPPHVQGALVALDVHTGAIRAMVGGRNFYESQFIPLETPYAFIAHSQGGTIGLRFAQECTGKKNAKRERDRDCSKGMTGEKFAYPRNLKGFITFGTPFWGSNFATKVQSSEKFQELTGNTKKGFTHLLIRIPHISAYID